MKGTSYRNKLIITFLIADLIILLVGCFVWLIISILKEKGIVIREALDKKSLIIRWAVYIALVMSVAMLGYISNTSGGFMYAQF